MSKNLKPIASQKLPVPYSLASITAPPKGSHTPCEEDQHREMDLHCPGDPDQTILCFNALEPHGQKQFLGMFHIHH